MRPTHTTLLAPAMALFFLAAACNSDKSSPPAPAPAPASAPAGANAAAAPASAEIGKPAPGFTLKDLDGKEHSLAKYKGKVVVLEWFSPGCPTCMWAYSKGPLVDMPERLMKDGVVWLAVNSEAPTNSSASEKNNRAFVDKYHLKAPILFDPTGSVGKTYGAKTTPHIFVIDPKGTLVYRGGLDNAPGGNVSGEGARVDYVGDAVTEVKAGRAVRQPDTKSYG
jgi:peroxiredoxin